MDHSKNTGAVPGAPRIEERGRRRGVGVHNSSFVNGSAGSFGHDVHTGAGAGAATQGTPNPVPWPSYGGHAPPAMGIPGQSSGANSSIDSSGASSRSTSVASTPSAVQVFDAMEREQEAIVNKLQREISTLREERPRSRSRSSSYSSMAASASLRPQDTIRRSRLSVGEQDGSAGLYRENEQLRSKIAELSLKLVERDQEIEALRSQLRD